MQSQDLQKDIVDVEDAKEVMQFYEVQLVQHLSQIAAIPSDPRDLAVEEIIKQEHMIIITEFRLWQRDYPLKTVR
ncbi:MAG: hypothetical protein WA667_20205 [Candidatus Nitrosopolaris sp.]